MTLKNELSVSLGLPVSPLVQNGELYTELSKVYNAIKAIARSLDAYTGVLGEDEAYWDQTGTDRCYFGTNAVIYLEAGEDLAYGSIVGIKSDGKAWKAQDGTLLCIGFCSAPGGSTAGDTTQIRLIGIYPAYPAATLTPGTRYYNSSTAGVVGVTAPTWNQIVGYAISDTTLLFHPQLKY